MFGVENPEDWGRVVLNLKEVFWSWWRREVGTGTQPVALRGGDGKVMLASGVLGNFVVLDASGGAPKPDGFVIFARSSSDEVVMFDKFAGISRSPFCSRRHRPRQGLVGFIAAAAMAAAAPATYMHVCWPQELLRGIPSRI